MGERCPTCDREGCQRERVDRESWEWCQAAIADGRAGDYIQHAQGRTEVAERQLAAVAACEANAVDWRARALAAERRLEYRPPADGSHRSEMMPVECCYHCGGPIRVRGFAVDGCACEGRR